MIPEYCIGCTVQIHGRIYHIHTRTEGELCDSTCTWRNASQEGVL